jgi:HK97 family phage prohead protease
MMLVKTCDAVDVKAVGDPKDGVFEAIVSVFGNKDSFGDVVVRGAFADTLSDWKASGLPIPVYYSHRMDDPNYNVGHVLEAKEIDRGLYVKAQLDITDPLPGSMAPQVHRLMKGGRLAQFSFAYEVQDAAMAKSEDLGDYYELRKLKLFEVGPTPIGANQATELLTIKAAGSTARHLSAELKAGRVISAKNETELRTAYEAIGNVLSALGDDQEPKTSGTEQVKTDEPAGAKADEPPRNPSVDALEAVIHLIELEGAAP